MSKVYIRDLKMPQSCWHCPVQVNAICASQQIFDFSSHDKRPDKCPLVEVPSRGKTITIPEFHGQWITPPPESDEQPYCSRCNWHAYGDLYTPYCPGCGAKMDGE